jgi:hypothetical protein
MCLIGSNCAENHIGFANCACRIIANDNPRILHLTGFVGGNVGVVNLLDVKGPNVTASPALA